MEMNLRESGCLLIKKKVLKKIKQKKQQKEPTKLNTQNVFERKCNITILAEKFFASLVTFSSNKCQTGQVFVSCFSKHSPNIFL